MGGARKTQSIPLPVSPAGRDGMFQGAVDLGGRGKSRRGRRTKNSSHVSQNRGGRSNRVRKFIMARTSATLRQI